MRKMTLKADTNTIIGIDYSLTSPAICINNGNLMFYYLTNKKKWQGMMDESIVGYEHKEWTDPIQRFTQISDFALDIIKDTYNPKIYIEGYSFGSKGQGLFQIAENCGIIIMVMNLAGVRLHTVVWRSIGHRYLPVYCSSLT